MSNSYFSPSTASKVFSFALGLFTALTCILSWWFVLIPLFAGIVQVVRSSRIHGFTSVKPLLATCAGSACILVFLVIKSFIS